MLLPNTMVLTTVALNNNCLLLFTHSSMHAFIQPVFIKHLLCARYVLDA